MKTYALMACLTIAAFARGTIINGLVDNNGVFSNVVRLEIGPSELAPENTYNCTGTVVADRTILTAGHCLYPLHQSPKSAVLKVNGDEHQVAKVKFVDEFLELQSKYLGLMARQRSAPFGSLKYINLGAKIQDAFILNSEYDLALLITKRPIAAAIPRTKLDFGRLRKGKRVVAVGYGYTGFSKEGGFFGPTTVANYRFERVVESPNSALAIANKNAPNGITAPGDSGSPLLIEEDSEFEQKGVLSGAFSIRPNDAPRSLYAPVRSHKRFLKKGLED